VKRRVISTQTLPNAGGPGVISRAADTNERNQAVLLFCQGIFSPALTIER
jgi:hypothetical protein